MKKIPRDDRRAQYIAGDRPVDEVGLAEFLVGKHRWVLATTRADGRPQMSLVSGGMTGDGRMMITLLP